MADFMPQSGQWVVFRAKLPDGVEALLDLHRKAGPVSDHPDHVAAHAYHTAAPHKSGDGFHVGIYHAPPNGPVVDGKPTAPPPPRVFLVNAMGDNVPGPHFADATLPMWKRNVTFALSEVGDLQAADTDDLPPGRHPSAPPRHGSGSNLPPAMPLNRGTRKRA